MGSLKFKTTHIICVLVLFFIGLPFGFGQTTSFKTKLSKNSVSTGERFEVIFELNSNGGNFKPPSLKGFKILSGPNKSTSIQMINGQVSSKLTYSYVLMAAEVGELTIGAASIKVGAQELKTEPVTLTVTKGSAVKPSNTNTGQNSNNKPDIADNLFIKLFVNKSKAFTGEQITATYKIYTRLSIVDNEVNTLPSFNGFWTQDVDLPQHTALRNEVLNGVPYQVATIKKVILFPQRSGKLKVDPMSLDVVVRIPQRSSSRNIFDQFFGRYKDVKYTISSNAQTINVKALPSNAPEAFDGAVGNYSFSAVIDKNEIETNDAINLKLTLSGQGNIKTLEDLDIDFPSDFEVYDPKIKDQINTTNGILSGKRTYEYLIIPRHAGEFTIDPIQFSYFDPKSKKYVDLSSGQFDIKVLK
ncbi:MAG: BatD family protein [Flavobacteriales bacterium]|nr:BatD family protein [Flavobacteriales bacterium]